MAEIIIYTKSHCPYCVKAKQLFKMKKVSYQEIDITDNASLLEEMLAKSSGRTFVSQTTLKDTLLFFCRFSSLCPSTAQWK